jgi:transcription-repair coupling factor (superfamily II helicase)
MKDGRQPGPLGAAAREHAGWDVPASGDGARHNVLDDPLAPTVTLDLNLAASIPEHYVPEAALRLQLYRRMAGLTTLEAVDGIAQEFADRFGPIPEEVANLLYVVRIKVLAVNAGVEAISQEEGQLVVKCALLETLDRRPLQRQLDAEQVAARVARRAIWLEAREDGERRSALTRTLKVLRAAEDAAK